METMNLDPREVAVLSTDNSQSFENILLNEFYAQGGEKAAIFTKALIDLLRPLGVRTINILEEHPEGHINFSTSYIGKSPFEWLTIDEVEGWTDECNGLSTSANFTVGELKAYLLKNGGKIQLWPEHGRKGTQGAQLMPPLSESDFDHEIKKGISVLAEAYSGFDQTTLLSLLLKLGIKYVIITGVVTEVCVRATALDALLNGFKVIIATDAIVGLSEESSQATLEELKSKGAILKTNQEIFNLFSKNPKVYTA